MNRLKYFACGIGLDVESGWIQIFPMGEPRLLDNDPLVVTRKDLEAVVADINARSNKVPVLFRHAKDSKYGGAAAGWIVEYEIREDGLWGRVDWVSMFEAEVKSGAWGYTSPGFYARKIDKERFTAAVLVEVSLTNTPNIAGMGFVRAENEDAPEARKGPTMDLEKLAAQLGVEATEEAVSKALGTLKENDAKFAALVAKDAAEAEGKNVVIKLNEIVETEVANRLAAAKREELVAKTMETYATRIPPAKKASVEALVKVNPEAMADVLAELPEVTTEKTVSKSVEGVELATADGTDLKQYDAALKFAFKHGISVEDAKALLAAKK